VVIGGSMLIADGAEVYNRYHLVEPDGTAHLHDKDLPTMWENAFYGPGSDDGVVETGVGRVGIAVCWELIRNQTARRMLGRVDLVLTGTHWWTVPANWGPVGRVLATVARRNRRLSESAPAELARRLGVPVVQASHCGRFRTPLGLIPGRRVTVPYRTHFVGATQIVDSGGRVLASRSTAEGPGVVVADVETGPRPPRTPIDRRFWTPRLPWLIRAYWWQQNAVATRYYRDTGRAAGLAAAPTLDGDGGGGRGGGGARRAPAARGRGPRGRRTRSEPCRASCCSWTPSACGHRSARWRSASRTGATWSWRRTSSTAPAPSRRSPRPPTCASPREGIARSSRRSRG